jgi:hypothetical protein
MAVIVPVITRVTDQTEESILVVWTSLLTASVSGTGVEKAQHADLCWQAVGANWGGATLTLQGSNDGTNWFSMTNAAGGAAATFTTDGGKQTIERPRYVRPTLTTAGTAADVTVTLYMRKQPQMRY